MSKISVVYWSGTGNTEEMAKAVLKGAKDAPLQYYKQAYEHRFQEYFAPFRFLNGNTRLIPVCDTLQINDYSKYDMKSFSEEHKRAVHDSEFPKALETAFKIGAGKV